jgi:RNA polymerase sigma-70 factor (ECF subfamily)
MGSEDLLAEAGWIRRLARALAQDDAAADDLAQETLTAALTHPPRRSGPLRPWLAEILRNAFRKRLRGETRRTRREQAVPMSEAVPSPEALVERAEMQRLLARLVLELDEPCRQTVLLRYYERLSSADIARKLGIPAGTVRARLSHGLARVRARLDSETGNRRKWQLALAPLWKGALVMNQTAKLGIAIAILVVALLGGWRLVHRSTTTANSAAPTMPAANLFVESGRPAVPIPAAFLQPGTAARRIAGRVVENGAPVGGASVVLSSLLTETSVIAQPTCATDGDGRFDFGPMPPVTWAVIAGAAGRTSAVAVVDLRDPASRSDQLLLMLESCQHGLSGEVKDAAGNAIAGARVTQNRNDMSNSTGPSVVTDARGHYELCVPSGDFGMDVSADGYGAISVRVHVRGHMHKDVVLVPEAVVVGRAVRLGDAAPVVGARVVLFGQGNGGASIPDSAPHNVVTDSAGRFRITRVAGGRYNLSAATEELVSTRPETITVASGQTTSEITLYLEGTSTIKGVARHGGAPVAGAVLYVASTARFQNSRRAVTQSDGSFTIVLAPRGRVRFQSESHDIVSPQDFEVMRAEHDGVQVELGARGVVGGRVVRGAVPVTNAEVLIVGRGFSHEAVSDTNGGFEFKGIPPGEYSVAANSDRLNAFGSVENVVLALGERKVVDVSLKWAAEISGSVVDVRGVPVPGVYVRFLNQAVYDEGTDVTAADGTFHATAMTGGAPYRPEVRLTARSPIVLPPAQGTAFAPILLRDGDSHVEGVRLVVRTERAAMSGSVVDADGTPRPDVAVVAQPTPGEPNQDFASLAELPSTFTDNRGEFRLDDLVPGRYDVRAHAADGADAVVRSVAAKSTGVVIRLPSSGVIDGTLVGFQKTPEIWASIAGAITRAEGIRGDVQGTAFRLTGLNPGRYLVMAASGTDGDMVSVDLTSTKRASVTLRSHGSASIKGRVVDFKKGDPVPAVDCYAMLRTGDVVGPSVVPAHATSDDQGRFLLDSVPAGDLVVRCFAFGIADNVAPVSVANGQRGEVEIPVVVRESGWSHSTIGVAFDVSRVSAIIAQLAPDGPAAHAGLHVGDVVGAVDGASVMRLAAPGVWTLIADRPVGSPVRLTVDRGGAAVTFEVVTERDPT